jgi:hypothetical protein
VDSSFSCASEYVDDSVDVEDMLGDEELYEREEMLEFPEIPLPDICCCPCCCRR